MNAKNRDARVDGGAARGCPACGAALAAERRSPGIVQRCGACGGFGLTIEALRNERGAGAAAALWTSVVRAPRISPRRCPSCGAPFAAVRAPRGKDGATVEACSSCRLLWFDRADAELPAARAASPHAFIRKASSRRLADAIAESAARSAPDDMAYGEPEQWWQWLAGWLGLPLLYDEDGAGRTAWVARAFALACVAAGVAALVGPPDLVGRMAFDFADPLRSGGLTIVSSAFAHVGPFHLLANLWFLLLIGGAAERDLGHGRFALLLVSAHVGGLLGLACAGEQRLVVGASGAIAGAIAYFGLRFPKRRIGVLLQFLFRPICWIAFPAIVWLGLWFVGQRCGALLLPEFGSPIAYAGHLGGAAAGAVAWALRRRDGVPAV